MKKALLLIICCYCFSWNGKGQTITSRLDAGVRQLETDVQFRNAVISFYVVNSKSGQKVYEKNVYTGLAPASCQKLLTSVTAFEELGRNFVYTTYIGKDPSSGAGYDAGSLYIIGKGDPTLGSWRWRSTVDTAIFSRIAGILRKNKLIRFERMLAIEDLEYGLNPVPGGWIWDDIGNYYGAACFGLNWHENQYDLVLQPGTTQSSPTAVVRLDPPVPGLEIINRITTGAPGSGDNGYIYCTPFSNFAFTSGTIPLQKGPFTISGSMPYPSKPFASSLMSYLSSKGIQLSGSMQLNAEEMIKGRPLNKATHLVDSLASPTLDSINYWFLKKSVNLYGEALLKSIARKYHPYIAPEKLYGKGIERIKAFWAEQDVQAGELEIQDGSGLSPANRLTTHALVSILQYARERPWFASFYFSLPEMNGIKMKDGYIGGVRSYAGYIKSRQGTEYSFSFIVNNFTGSAGSAREKIWKLLDLLK